MEVGSKQATAIQRTTGADNRVTETAYHVRESALPSPEDLGKYHAISPQFAEAVMAMATKAQDSQIELKREFMHQSRLGMKFAFALALACLILCGAALFLGHIEFAAAAGLMGVILPMFSLLPKANRTPIDAAAPAKAKG